MNQIDAKIDSIKVDSINLIALQIEVTDAMGTLSALWRGQISPEDQGDQRGCANNCCFLAGHQVFFQLESCVNFAAISLETFKVCNLRCESFKLKLLN